MEGGELFDRIQKKGHFTERGTRCVYVVPTLYMYVFSVLYIHVYIYVILHLVGFAGVYIVLLSTVARSVQYCVFVLYGKETSVGSY